MIFKVLPEGKVVRQHISPFNESSDSISHVEEEKTAVGFYPKKAGRKNDSADEDEYFF